MFGSTLKCNVKEAKHCFFPFLLFFISLECYRSKYICAWWIMEKEPVGTQFIIKTLQCPLWYRSIFVLTHYVHDKYVLSLSHYVFYMHMLLHVNFVMWHFFFPVFCRWWQSDQGHQYQISWLISGSWPIYHRGDFSIPFPCCCHRPPSTKTQREGSTPPSRITLQDLHHCPGSLLQRQDNVLQVKGLAGLYQLTIVLMSE